MTVLGVKQIYKDKMQTAIENFMTAEEEGAEKLAPDTYAWAKAKIYNNKKILLQYPADEKKVQEATDDAAAAAAKLLAKVREKERQSQRPMTKTPEQVEKEALKVLVNEGGPIA
jgi:hypothetical protein